MASSAAELPMAILQTLLLELVLGLQHLGLGRLQRVIETAQHGERQDDFLELALLEGTVEQIGDRPEEADDGVEICWWAHAITLCIVVAEYSFRQDARLAHEPGQQQNLSAVPSYACVWCGGGGSRVRWQYLAHAFGAYRGCASKVHPKLCNSLFVLLDDNSD